MKGHITNEPSISKYAINVINTGIAVIFLEKVLSVGSGWIAGVRLG